MLSEMDLDSSCARAERMVRISSPVAVQGIDVLLLKVDAHWRAQLPELPYAV